MMSGNTRIDREKSREFYHRARESGRDPLASDESSRDRR